MAMQEAAFYSAKNTGLDESHDIFKTAMPGGFSWEVTEVYSGCETQHCILLLGPSHIYCLFELCSPLCPSVQRCCATERSPKC